MKTLTQIKEARIPIGEYVYKTIKKDIISFKLVPGQRISEKEIADKLNVSRTPVREAFIKLSRERLVYALPQKGTYISYINLDMMEDVRFIRESLEKSVLQIATNNFPSSLIDSLENNIEKQVKLAKEGLWYDFILMDNEFHKIIFMGCNKVGIWEFLEQISPEYMRARMLTFMVSNDWENVVLQHRQILESINKRDEEKGTRIISKHIRKLAYEQIELKIKHPEYFVE